MLSLSQPPGSLFPYSSLSSLVQVSGGVGSVAFSSWPTLDTMYDTLPSLNLQAPSFSIVLSCSSQWWSRLCRHSPPGPPRLPCTMLMLSQPPGSLFLYSALSPLVQASAGVGSVAILLLAHLGYHVGCSRSFSLQAPSFSIVLCPLLFKPLVA